jgi:hypothetical protein
MLKGLWSETRCGAGVHICQRVVSSTIGFQAVWQEIRSSVDLIQRTDCRNGLERRRRIPNAVVISPVHDVDQVNCRTGYVLSYWQHKLLP